MPEAHAPGNARTVAIALAVACLAATRTALGPSAAGLVLDAAAAVVAVVATLHAARRARPGRSRLAWRVESSAIVVWLLAPLAWLTGLPDAVATAGRVGLVVLWGTVCWLTSLRRDPWGRLRLLVDSALVGASLFVVTWDLLLEDVWASQGGRLPGILAVALPLAAITVAAQAAGVALFEIRRRRRAMPVLVVAACVAIAASDVAWALGGTPLWAVGFALVTWATRVYRGTSKRREVVSTSSRLVYAPYAILAPAIITMVVQHQGAGVPQAEATTGVVMGVLLLVRQHATIMENRRLVRRLEATEAKLRHRAMHDALTGLGGRALLHDKLEAAVRRHAATGEPLAVVFMDLDDFKLVNDTFGHAAGDAVLVEIARRLRRALEPLGPDAAAFRMSGDEFAVLLGGPAAARPDETARVLLDTVAVPVRVGDDELRVHGSVGVAVARGTTTDSSDLLRAADVAMYGVKHTGKGGVAVAAEGQSLRLRALEVAPPVRARS